jgi:hypothetical protein
MPYEERTLIRIKIIDFIAFIIYEISIVYTRALRVYDEVIKFMKG